MAVLLSSVLHLCILFRLQCLHSGDLHPVPVDGKGKYMDLLHCGVLLRIQLFLFDELLCLEEVYSNPERSKEVSQEKSNLEDRLAELYELWEELM